MQGYIIDIRPVREDDLIVIILTENEILTTYRFYGARHSNINIGYKIDFELEITKSDFPRLRDVIHLSFPWILNNEKLYCWQRYIKLFYSHLKDIEDIDSFYFYLLDNLVHIMQKQNSLRAICESYINLLDYEGRLQMDLECILCEKLIEDKVSMIRGFLLVHPSCVYSDVFELSKISEMFLTKKTINLKNEEVEVLWNILLEGL